MRRAIAVVVAAFLVCIGSATAQPAPYGGANSYPRTEAETRAYSQALARRSSQPIQVVNITRNSVPGQVVARGRRLTGELAQNRSAEQEPSPCEYDVTFSVTIAEGAREFTVTPQPDCTLMLQEIRDVDVVEPDQVVANQEPKGRLRNILASLWEAFFPRLTAQIWVQRSVYQHIYTCGVACAGGIDGLTAQQTWMHYEQSSTQVRATRLYGWYCVAGQYWNGVRYVSNCQPPLEVPNAPMFSGNTGWRAFNGWPSVRDFGPNPSTVRTGDRSEFDWNAAGPAYHLGTFITN